jgi:hypothetical protein
MLRSDRGSAGGNTIQVSAEIYLAAQKGVVPNGYLVAQNVGVGLVAVNPFLENGLVVQRQTGAGPTGVASGFFPHGRKSNMLCK